MGDMAVLDSYQLLMPRYSFNGNERKQHFFLDVMDSTNTTDVESKSKEEEEVHDACHDETKYNDNDDNNNDDNNRKSKKKKRYMMHVMTRQNTMIRMIIIIKEEEGKKTKNQQYQNKIIYNLH